MKTKQVTKYICDICGSVFSNKEDALFCESHAVVNNKPVNVGDVVTITSGDGWGELAKVTKLVVFPCGSGCPKRYWHTVMAEVNLINSFSSRLLFFDGYELT